MIRLLDHLIMGYLFSLILHWRRDTQHDDTQLNDTQHNNREMQHWVQLHSAQQ